MVGSTEQWFVLGSIEQRLQWSHSSQDSFLRHCIPTTEIHYALQIPAKWSETELQILFGKLCWSFCLFVQHNTQVREPSTIFSKCFPWRHDISDHAPALESAHNLPNHPVGDECKLFDQCLFGDEGVRSEGESTLALSRRLFGVGWEQGSWVGKGTCTQDLFAPPMQERLAKIRTPTYQGRRPMPVECLLGWVTK